MGVWSKIYSVNSDEMFLLQWIFPAHYSSSHALLSEYISWSLKVKVSPWWNCKLWLTATTTDINILTSTKLMRHLLSSHPLDEGCCSLHLSFIKLSPLLDLQLWQNSLYFQGVWGLFSCLQTFKLIRFVTMAIWVFVAHIWII